MLEDYKKAVIFNYHNKKERGLLSPNLMHPTPGRLRDEGLIALRSRTQEKDTAFLKDFFNSGTESVDYSYSIRKFDVDRLRPLVNLLNDRIERPDPNNVELLAWLIGFEPRPYDSRIDYAKYLRPEEEDIIADRTLTSLQVPPREPASASKQSGKPFIESNLESPFKTKKIIVVIAVFVLIIGGTYLYIDQTRAYICDQGAAKKYHLSSKCPALKNCKNGVVQTTITSAEKNGKTLCGFELK